MLFVETFIFYMLRVLKNFGWDLEFHKKMKLFHSKVIRLTTAYYNSLYLTSVFIQLYITGLFVVSYSMPYGGSHGRSCPLYILTFSPDLFFPDESFLVSGIDSAAGM